VYGNCPLCGLAEAIPGALYFEVAGWVIEKMEEDWARSHQCGTPDLYGFTEYGT